MGYGKPTAENYAYFFHITKASAFVSYLSDDDVSSREKNLPLQMASDFNLPAGESIVPESFYYIYDNSIYRDEGGQIVRHRGTNETDIIGRIDYANQRIVWSLNVNHDMQKPRGLLTKIGDNGLNTLSFVIPQIPVLTQSFTISATTTEGVKITATANASGEISGAGISGKIDYLNGLVAVNFGKKSTTKVIFDEQNERQEITEETPILVSGESVSYSAVAYTTLPLNSDGLGIDPARLPADGRVPIFRNGDMIVIRNEQVEDLGSAFRGGQVVQLSRQDLTGCCLFDSENKPVEGKWFETNLKAGTITFVDNLNLSGYALPLIAHHEQSETNRLLNVDLDGTLTLQFPLSRDYPLENTYISSALIAGDLELRHSVPFVQKTFNNVWLDEIQGDASRNKLNLNDFPMVLTNAGAITDRWALIFKNATNLEVWSEALGFVGQYDIISDLAPINPVKNEPYFTIPKQAFAPNGQSAWAVGETIRFNTFGTHCGAWIIRAVQPSAVSTTETDGFALCLRGNTTQED